MEVEVGIMAVPLPTISSAVFRMDHIQGSPGGHVVPPRALVGVQLSAWPPREQLPLAGDLSGRCTGPPCDIEHLRPPLLADRCEYAWGIREWRVDRGMPALAGHDTSVSSRAETCEAAPCILTSTRCSHMWHVRHIFVCYGQGGGRHCAPHVTPSRMGKQLIHMPLRGQMRFASPPVQPSPILLSARTPSCY